MKARIATVATFVVTAALVPASLTNSPAGAAAGMEVAGTIATDTTWTAADSPVTVTGPVTIPAGITLTVEPGVDIRDATRTNSNIPLFAVTGSFIAVGTDAAPVGLRSTEYHPVFAGPTGSVTDTATGVVELDHVVLDFDTFLPWSPTDNSPALARVSIADSAIRTDSSMALYRTREIDLSRNSVALGRGNGTAYALGLGPGRTSTTIEDNRFRATQIHCDGGPLALRNNTFEWYASPWQGRGSGIRVLSPSCPVDARDNNWESGDDLSERNYDGRNAVGLPVIDVSTRLEAPSAATPHLPPGPMDSMYVEARVTGVRVRAGAGNPGGLPTAYTVGAYPVGSTVPEQEQVTDYPYAEFRGLDPAKEYLFQIEGRNDLGLTSRRSTSATRPKIEATIPSKPTVELTLQSRAVGLTFYSDSDGGTPISYYQWSIDGPDLTGVTGSGGKQTHATFTGLTPGEQYTVTVYAVNEMGESDKTTISFTAASAPATPGAVTAARGNKSAHVAWAPVSGNGLPVTSYTVTASPSGGTCSTHGLKCTVNGLANGTAYTFTVVATNDVGTSNRSPASKAVSPAGVPPRMKAPKVVLRGAKTIIKWAMARPNGSPVTRYLVDISKGKDMTVAAKARQSGFKGLKPGKYRVRVAARNAVGAGKYSTWVAFRIR